jgi:hypothetical protein
LAVTVVLITCAVLAFRYAVIYLDILPRRARNPKRWIANAAMAANA